MLYINIIHDTSKKINTFLKISPKNYTVFKIFGGNNKSLNSFLAKIPYAIQQYMLLL